MTATFDTQTTVARPNGVKKRVKRAFFGGRLGDLGRLPRYIGMLVLGGTLIWAPIMGYLATAPLSYKSYTSLILPGSGASASMNLNGIGQASSFASSPFASNAVSPTETYKRLLNADRIIDAAAASLDISRRELGRPRVDLVDQTSLIHFEMTGGSPIEAQARANAILAAFMTELDALRMDELQTRETGGLAAIQDYQRSVGATRAEIARLQEETGLLSIAQYDELLTQHTLLESELRTQSVTVIELQTAAQTLEASLGIDSGTAALTLKLFADEEYRQHLRQIAQHASVLSDNRAVYGENHPLVTDALRVKTQAETAASARAIALTGLDLAALSALDLAPDGQRAFLLAELVEMHANLKGETERLAALREADATQSEQLNAMSGAVARLQDLQRDFSVAEAVFASAIARAESTKSDVYASYPLVQVLENPSLPERPSSPNRMLAYAAGVAATIMMLIGLVLAWCRLFIITWAIRKTVTDT